MINFGPVPAGSVLPVFFSTYGKTNGESITLTDLAVTDVEVYKGTSMTQRASDNGYALIDTDGIDIDGITGIHGFSIDTGDNSDSGFYSVGSFFNVVVSAVTIDGQTVNFIAATFRIVAAEAIAGKPKVDVDGWNGTAVASPHTAGYPAVTVKDGTGTGEIDTASGKVSIVSGDITSIQNGLATASALATAQTSLDDIPTNAELATALADADDAVLTAIAALNNLSAAQVNAEVVDALATDTYGEPTGVPGATVSLATKLGRVYQALRNQIDITATDKTFYNDAGSALWKKALSDDATTYTEGEGAAP